jgi:hypothetical protein
LASFSGLPHIKQRENRVDNNIVRDAVDEEAEEWRNRPNDVNDFTDEQIDHGY